MKHAGIAQHPERPGYQTPREVAGETPAPRSTCPAPALAAVTLAIALLVVIAAIATRFQGALP